MKRDFVILLKAVNEKWSQVDTISGYDSLEVAVAELERLKFKKQPNGTYKREVSEKNYTIAKVVDMTE